jgi:hypothetical protein
MPLWIKQKSVKEAVRGGLKRKIGLEIIQRLHTYHSFGP